MRNERGGRGADRKERRKKMEGNTKEEGRKLVTRAHRYSKKASASSKINRIIYESSFRIILCSVCSRDLLLFPSETHSTGVEFSGVEIIVPLANQAMPSPLATKGYRRSGQRDWPGSTSC